MDFDILQYQNLKIKDPRKPEKQVTKETWNQKNRKQSKPGTKKPRKPWNPKTRINQDIKTTRNQNIPEKLGNQEIYEYR